LAAATLGSFLNLTVPVQVEKQNKTKEKLSKQLMSSPLIHFVTNRKVSFESCEIMRRKNSVPHNPTAFIESSTSAARSGSSGSIEPRH